MGFGDLDCGRSCDYKVGSPSYLDKIAWREGKPQHYSEPKLILDLSHWKRNTNCLAVPAELIGGSVEDLGEMKEVDEEEEEPGDLFQEISRWVESTQSRLHSPSPSPFLEQRSLCSYTSSPPLPLSPGDLPAPVFHYTEVVQQPSAEYDIERLSLLPPVASSSNSLPSLFPSSPMSPLPPSPPQTASPPTSPFFLPQESQPLSSASSVCQPTGNDPLESLPAKQRERLFDLDVFISRALKLCRQNKEKSDGKKGKEGGWREENKQANICKKVARLPEHRSPPTQTPNS